MISKKDILDRTIGKPEMMPLIISGGTYETTGQLISGILLMEKKDQKRNIDLQKISAEKLNGRFAFLGVNVLVGAYISKGQVISGIV